MNPIGPPNPGAMLLALTAFHNKIVQPTEFQNGRVVTEKEKLPAALRDKRVVQFEFDGQSSFAASTRDPREREFVLTDIYRGAAFEPVASAKQWFEDEGGDFVIAGRPPVVKWK